MENKSHALAAGTFVLALLAVLIALAVWLTRDNRALRTFELSSASAVTGLQPEASVRFKGVDVGKVTAIGFDPLQVGHVLIRIAVDDQTPLTESTFATLGFQGVTGLAFIALAKVIGFLIPATLCGLGVSMAFDAKFNVKTLSMVFVIAGVFWTLFSMILGVDLGPIVQLPF